MRDYVTRTPNGDTFVKPSVQKGILPEVRPKKRLVNLLKERPHERDRCKIYIRIYITFPVTGLEVSQEKGCGPSVMSIKIVSGR